MKKEVTTQKPINYSLDYENNKIDIKCDKVKYTVTLNPFSYTCEANQNIKNANSKDNIVQEDDDFLYFIHDTKSKDTSIFGSISKKLMDDKSTYIAMIDKKTGSFYSGYINKHGILDHDIEIYYKSHDDSYKKTDLSEKHFVSLTKDPAEKFDVKTERFGDGKLYQIKNAYIYYPTKLYQHYNGNAFLKYEKSKNSKNIIPHPVVIGHGNGYIINPRDSKIVKGNSEFLGDIDIDMHPDFRQAYNNCKKNNHNLSQQVNKEIYTSQNTYLDTSYYENDNENTDLISSDKKSYHGNFGL